MDTDDAGSLTGFIPFAATLDIKVVDMTSERVIATMSWAGTGVRVGESCMAAR